MRPRLHAWLACLVLAGCGSEAPDDEVNASLGTSIPRVLAVQEALSTTDIATLDPHTMNDAEIAKALGAKPFCAFRYVSDGKPVLAWESQSADSGARAVVKLNGGLVELQHDSDAGGARFVAGELYMEVTPNDAQERARPGSRPRQAKLLFEVGEKLRVGYSGYFICPS